MAVRKKTNKIIDQITSDKTKEEKNKTLEKINSILTEEPEELFEYINITDTENMFLQVYGQEDKIQQIQVKPRGTVWLNKKDILHYKNDPRFIMGRIIPLDEKGVQEQVKTATNTMTNLQVENIIKISKSIDDLLSRMKKVTSIVTAKRFLNIIKKLDKPNSWVTGIENFIKNLQKEQI